MITFAAWEGVEAEASATSTLRTFKFTDYGFPDFYQVVLACDRDWLAREPGAAKAFVGATVRGFEFAAAEPDAAAQILLVQQNPGVFDANPEVPTASARYLAERGLLVDAQGNVGHADARAVAGYSRLPVRPGPADRRDRQAADDRRPTTRRCSRTTSCRAAG